MEAFHLWSMCCDKCQSFQWSLLIILRALCCLMLIHGFKQTYLFTAKYEETVLVPLVAIWSSCCISFESFIIISVKGLGLGDILGMNAIGLDYHRNCCISSALCIVLFFLPLIHYYNSEKKEESCLVVIMPSFQFFSSIVFSVYCKNTEQQIWKCN